MTFTDQVLPCADCGQDFVFSAGEQEFYSEKGLTNSPKRCKDCRESRKQRHRGGSRGGGGKKLYDTICSNCGSPTKVPFKPSQDRPIYCRSCMQ